MSNEIALRTEVGFDLGLFDTFLIPGDVQTIWVPVISLEPRWYYNLNRRIRKGKRITRNTGNFLSLSVTYHPDLFVLNINDPRDIRIRDQIAIVPTYGLRRSLGKHFSYEFGIGFGYRHVFEERQGTFTRPGYSDLTGNLLLRIGFDF